MTILLLAGLAVGLVAGRPSAQAQDPTSGSVETAASHPSIALGTGAPQQREVGEGGSLVVYLMTMGPGGPIYERFGHNAIWIRDTVAGTDLIYNFGMFDFAAPGFVGNFVRGRPRYRLEALDLATTMYIYRQAQRQLEVQELALPKAARAALARDLALNALPANREYDYDYYRDNCSTRVRDALDRALGGSLRRATVGRAGEGSYRFHTQRSTANNAFYYLGIEAAMGRRTDRLLDQWEEMFLPSKVQERVRELRVTGDDGREVPLVTREATLLEFSRHQVLAAPPDWTPRLLFAGALLALLLASGLLEGAGGGAGRALVVVWGVATTLAGALLIFLAGFTNHVMTGQNLNLLLFSPLALGLLPLLLGRGRAPWARRAVIGYLSLMWLAALPALAGALQHNREITALVVLPGSAAAAVALVLSRRRAAVPPAPR